MSSNFFHTFGKQQVSAEERKRRLADVFERIAPHYDHLCDLMTFGLHRVWRRALVRAIKLQPGQRILDLAGGAGEVARLLAQRDRLVIVVDPSLAMMNKGRSQKVNHVSWVGAVGQALPFPDAAMDIVTIAFGIRNITYIEAALKEIARVLKPGGHFFCLEVSQPAVPFKTIYDVFLRKIIPTLGSWVIPAPDAYAYLVESIRGFPNQEELKGLLENAGFTDVHYRNLSFGIACLHLAKKGGTG